MLNAKRLKSFLFALACAFAVACIDETIQIFIPLRGPGIKDVNLAMQEGYSTAKDNVRALGFGAGMGLPNMKRYTDRMNIETVVGQGTTVTMEVDLPAQ